MTESLERLEAGMAIPYAGNRVARVAPELAAAFRPGDRLVVVQDTGDLLHIPADTWKVAESAVERAVAGFAAMGSVGAAAVTDFYLRFAAALEDDTSFGEIAAANTTDLERARQRGRSTTRLELTEGMRGGMIEGLRLWAETATDAEPLETVEHGAWRVETFRAGLGVVGFVFEGRPNVFADATGVLRTGNSVVFRIGSDALGTARAIMTVAVEPSLAAAGLHPGAVSLVDSPERAAGWALFSDPRLGLAVARGSGTAVSQLGAVARQTGIPVSLHGTGGAWMVVAADAQPATLETIVANSLDRKVCNTLNTVVIVGESPRPRIEAVLDGLRTAAADRNAEPKLHFVGDVDLDPWWHATAPIRRAGGDVAEPRAEPIEEAGLSIEWEWEDSPEITLICLPTLDQAIAAFNRHSPRFVVSLISADPSAHDAFYAAVDAPFVGNGFTRWVDGQYALNRPELGLSNWQFGRLFGRGGILSGDSIYTLRTRMIQHEPGLRR